MRLNEREKFHGDHTGILGLSKANCILLLAKSTVVLFDETLSRHSRAVCRFRRSDYTENGKWTFAEVNIAFGD